MYSVSTTSSFAPEWSQMYRTSSAESLVLIGTMTAPASGTPKLATSISGMLGHMYATRSPGCMPEAWSARQSSGLRTELAETHPALAVGDSGLVGEHVRRTLEECQRRQGGERGGGHVFSRSLRFQGSGHTTRPRSDVLPRTSQTSRR